MKNNIITKWEREGEYCKIDKWNLRVFYKDIGDSNALADKTLLLLHGFPESSFSWSKIVAGMLEIFDRVVLFDFPGFGRSDKSTNKYPYSILSHADVAQFVWEHLNIKGGHLLAHDMGVSVATELVTRDLEKLLLSSFSDGFQSYTFTNGSMVIELAQLRITQKILLSPFGFLLSKLLFFRLFQKQIKSAHGNDNLSEEDIRLLWENVKLQRGNRKAHYLIRYYKDRIKYEQKRWLPALQQTRIPIHICWGDEDQVAQVAMAYHLKEKVCPSARLSIMPGLGHFCQLGNPEVWIQYVSSFYLGLRKPKKE